MKGDGEKCECYSVLFACVKAVRKWGARGEEESGVFMERGRGSKEKKMLL